jgi:CubicO group peptidase (beta-lactamase class C family)
MYKINVFSLIVLVCISAGIYSQEAKLAPWPTQNWPQAPKETLDKYAELIEGVDRYIGEKLPNTTSVFIVKDGYVLKEGYYKGDADTLRMTYSVTKSVISALIGILLDQKTLDNIDQKVETIIPSVFTEDSEKAARSVTVRHALTMTCGFEPSMTDGIGKEDISMLFQIPFADKPGKKFYYNEINYNLLSMVTTELIGMLASEYAKKNLFSVIGINKYSWGTRNGYTVGGDELRLSTRDMARLGYLYLRKGVWNNQQVISETWIQDSTKTQVATGRKHGDGNWDYGFGWWTATIGGYRTYEAYGYLGQIICIVPDIDMVAVLTGEEEKAGDRIYIVKDLLIPYMSKE